MKKDIKIRGGFQFFRSFQEAIDRVDEKNQLALYRGIVGYALDHIEPTFKDPLLELIWTLVKPNLDSGWYHFINGCGGGAPIGNNNASKTTKKQPRNNQKTTKKQPKNNQPIYDKEKEMDMDMDMDIDDNKEKTDAKKDELSLSLSDRKEAFLKELEQYREEYEADMLNDFFEYWTEPNKSQTKMRFEAQKFFKTKSRLNAWKNRKFNK